MHYRYAQVLTGENSGNCQEFVRYVMQKMGMGQVLDNLAEPIRHYLQQLRNDGISTMIFKASQEFALQFAMPENPISFTSHKQLDEFVIHLATKCQQLQITNIATSKYKGEYSLLKSFDRAFWLRHFKNTTSMDYLPKCTTTIKGDNVSFDCACPFSNPQLNGSIVMATKK